MKGENDRRGREKKKNQLARVLKEEENSLAQRNFELKKKGGKKINSS